VYHYHAGLISCWKLKLWWIQGWMFPYSLSYTPDTAVSLSKLNSTNHNDNPQLFDMPYVIGLTIGHWHIVSTCFYYFQHPSGLHSSKLQSCIFHLTCVGLWRLAQTQSRPWGEWLWSTSRPRWANNQCKVRRCACWWRHSSWYQWRHSVWHVVAVVGQWWWSMLHHVGESRRWNQSKSLYQ